MTPLEANATATKRLRHGPLDSQAAHDRWWVVEDFRVEHEKQLAIDLALAAGDEHKTELALVASHERIVAFVRRDRS